MKTNFKLNVFAIIFVVIAGIFIKSCEDKDDDSNPSWVVVMEDNFTGDNGAAPSTEKWVSASYQDGTTDIQNNQLACYGGSIAWDYGGVAVKNMPTNPASLRLTVKGLVNDTSSAISLGFMNALGTKMYQIAGMNGSLVFMALNTSNNPTNPALLSEFSSLQYEFDELTLELNTTYNLSITLDEGEIIVTVDNGTSSQTISNAISTDLTTGDIGMCYIGGGEAANPTGGVTYFDDFKLEKK